MAGSGYPTDPLFPALWTASASQLVGTVNKESAVTQNHVKDIRIRHIRPDDWHRLQCFHNRLSVKTAELRFHGAKLQLSEPLAHRFTQLDGRDDVALVATTGTWGRIIGVARYNRVKPDTAEVAFVVEDEYQGQHVGTRLMRRLKLTALQNGITKFVAELVPGNVRMLRLLEYSGTTKVHLEGSECEVWVDLLEEET
jgi:RimJ/RimL family protein N-acetyltransferase